MQKPDPFLTTEGIHNFRDFGGWPGADGKTVRTGLLYRSGQHVEASDEDLAAIAALDMRAAMLIPRRPVFIVMSHPPRRSEKRPSLSSKRPPRAIP